MYEHVMVPLDGSKVAECVLPHLNSIARGCAVKRVTIVRVVEKLHLLDGVESMLPPDERERLETTAMDDAKAYLDKIARNLDFDGVAVEPLDY